jgi:hypothetical protein
LTPRGQTSFFSSSSIHPPSSDNQEYNFQIHIWNGLDCGSLARALALAKGNELEILLSKA